MSEPVVYTVERWNWRWVGDGYLLRLPGGKRVRTFDSLDEAESFRAEREADARRKINPFKCGGVGVHYWTSLDLPRLHDWLLDADVEPPTLKSKGPGINWVAWYERRHHGWSEYQTAKVWEALDKVRFFGLVAGPRRPVVYVVSYVNWVYNDNWHDAEETEGGFPMAAYRSYDRAEARRRELEEHDRQRWSGGILNYSQRTWALYDPLGDGEPPTTEDMFLPTAEAPFYEVIEVELMDDGQAAES